MWMFRNGFITSWQALLQALETRFAPTYYEDPKGALFKLTQRGSVNDYLLEFERLANRIVGLPSSSLLSCFISGLSPEIRREVLALQPISLPQAIALAKLQEDKVEDRCRSYRGKPNNSAISPSSSSTTTTPASSTPLLPTPPKMHFKKLNSEEIAARREKGLCYNCDDKWGPNHKCKARFFFIVAEEDEEPHDPEPPIADLSVTSEPPPLNPQPDPPNAQISFNALSGTLAPESLRLFGHVGQMCVTILIDGGSTHNFIQSRVAKFLSLSTQHTQALKVIVGNGTVLDCNQICPHTTLLIQGQKFEVDLYVLPISGADIVLGIQWLKRLGPIITDYDALTMQFSRNGHPILLRADAPTLPEDASPHQVKRFLPTHAAYAFFHIAISPSPTPIPNHNTTHTILEIASLLSKYNSLFQTPTQLPPPRDITHKIHLLPNSKPVNVRPYQYPHFQKGEIEKQVVEMLSSGMIQISHSPFSSPVLLVKKKDGSWRFCVDYRALNALTIKDRFPMPTIDELLDELGHASSFSKLDLRQGFHQILMDEADIPKTAFRTHQGHYKYRVMSFGLCNAPSTFQATMNELLKPFLCKFAAVFFDDILVYSSSFESHLQHLESVFQALLNGIFFL